MNERDSITSARHFDRAMDAPDPPLTDLQSSSFTARPRKVVLGYPGICGRRISALRQGQRSVDCLDERRGKRGDAAKR